MTAPETSAQAADPGITVRVESFVGPLDLLLHLCRTNEMDLSRLSLRTITDQYLAHLEAVRFQDLETAGSFMVMAATLIYLKSKLLLPASPDDPEEALDEEGELLKRELEERLREYARVKALGAWLSEREAEQSLVYGRTTAELPPPEDIPLEDLSVHLLQRAMQRLIEDQKRRVPRQVEPNPLSVLERMGEITDLLRSTWSLLFSSVAGAERLRAEWVVTLLALLELVRLGQARARQAELFGEIVIERHSVSVREPIRDVEPADEPLLDEEPTRNGPAVTETPAGAETDEPPVTLQDAAVPRAEESEGSPPTEEIEPPRAAAAEPPEAAPMHDHARTEEGESRNA